MAKVKKMAWGGSDSGFSKIAKRPASSVTTFEQKKKQAIIGATNKRILANQNAKKQLAEKYSNINLQSKKPAVQSRISEIPRPKPATPATQPAKSATPMTQFKTPTPAVRSADFTSKKTPPAPEIPRPRPATPATNSFKSATPMTQFKTPTPAVRSADVINQRRADQAAAIQKAEAQKSAMQQAAMQQAMQKSALAQPPASVAAAPMKIDASPAPINPEPISLIPSDDFLVGGGMGGGNVGMKKGGSVKMKRGGFVKSSASKRGDGVAQRGKTRGKFV